MTEQTNDTKQNIKLGFNIELKKESTDYLIINRELQK